MPVCDLCGDRIGRQSYRCNYCNQYHCTDHRLPETHDCPALGDLGRPTSVNHGSDAVLIGRSKQQGEQVKGPDGKPYTVYEPTETVGTRKEVEGTSSPDVNPDGSLDESRVDARTDARVSTTQATDSVRSWFRIGWLQAGSTAKQLIRLVGISMIVLGAFNLVLAPVVSFGPLLVESGAWLVAVGLIVVGLIVIRPFI